MLYQSMPTYCTAALLGVGSLAIATHAQARTFDGGGNGTTWTDAVNWSDDDAPDTLAEDATIDAGGAWSVASSGSTLNIGQLTVGADDSLTLNNRINAASIGSIAGDVTVNAGGFLNVNGPWTNDGTLTINEFGNFGTAGATDAITNNGTIQGASFINTLGFLGSDIINNGTIAPGFGENNTNGIGFASDLTLASTSVLDIEIGGGSTAFSFDYISVVLDLTLGGELQLTQFNGYEPSPSVSLTIIDATSADSTTGSFTNIASGERLATTDGAGSWLVTYSDNDVVISDYQPVPEPSSLVPLAGAGLILMRRRRAQTR